MSCDSLMPFNCLAFTVEYLRWLSFRIFSTAATSLPDVPFPLNRRMEGGSLSVAGGSQPVRATDAMHAMSWMIRFFTISKQRLIRRHFCFLSKDHISRVCVVVRHQLSIVKSNNPSAKDRGYWNGWLA